MIVALIAGLATFAAAAIGAYFANRHFSKTAPADAAQKITDAAIELLEPYQKRVTDLEQRLDKTEQKLADVRVALSVSSRRVDALTAQVVALGHVPVRI